MLSVTKKPFKLGVVMLNVIMLGVVMLNVVAPLIAAVKKVFHGGCGNWQRSHDTLYNDIQNNITLYEILRNDSQNDIMHNNTKNDIVHNNTYNGIMHNNT